MFCGTVILKVGSGDAGALWPLTVPSTNCYQLQNCALQLKGAHPYRETIASGVPYSHSRLFRVNKRCHTATSSHSVHASLRPPGGLLYLHIIAFHLDKRQRVYYFMLEEKTQKSVLDWAFGFLCIMSMLATVTFLKPLTTCYLCR